MPLSIGETREVQGSGAKPYIVKRCDEHVFSCTCPKWRMAGGGVMRTCKHIVFVQGQAAEDARMAGVVGGKVVKPVALPVGVPAPQCACHQGGTCDVSHDPSACTCVQCTTAEAESPEDIIAQVMGAKPLSRPAEPKENAIQLKGDGIERDKSKRLNAYGGFEPFTDQEKAAIVAEEEAKKGRKLRQDEKADLFGPDLLLANQFEDCEDLDPTGWLESEKLDGLRGMFNGEVFISRQGNVFAAPDFFSRGIPQVPLDGELWTGRGKAEFQVASSIVRSGNSGEAWKKVKFVVFDAPAQPGTFEERLAYLQSLQLPAHVVVHPHQACDGREGLLRRLQETAQAGGEGRMLRKPGSRYEPRRSNTLLKVKPFQDAEAEVISHVAGKGRHKGRLGGLTVKTSDGRIFNVGTGLTDAERRNPPPIGCTITYRFAGCTADGLPKCVSFLRIRPAE
jgi:DNA ligase-1